MKRAFSGAAACIALVCVVGCGYFPNSANGPDPYLGYVDGLGLDPKFEPQPPGTTCPNGPCYPVQQGWAHGNRVFFYNLGAISSSSPLLVDANGNAAFPTSLVTTRAYDFSGSSCTPPTDPYTFDPVREAYPSDQQFPVFSALPLTSYVFNALVVPIVAHYGAQEPQGTTCQSIKEASSVGAKLGTGAGSLVDYQIWPVIDVVTALTVTISNGITSSKAVNGTNCAVTPSNPQVSPACPVAELPTGANSASLITNCTNTFNACSGACQTNPCTIVCQRQFIACATLERQGWANGLQLTYLNGGAVPLADASDFVIMDGVIVHPTGTENFSNVYANTVVILPAVPGEPGFSPIVRLHDFHVPQGVDLDPFGDFSNTVFTDICASGVGCQPNQVNLMTASGTTNIVFVVMPQ